MPLLLFISLITICSFSFYNLNQFILFVDRKVELIAITKIWLIQKKISITRQPEALICEDQVMKFCFHEKNCHRVFNEQFNCNANLFENNLVLRINNGYRFRKFNYIRDDHNSNLFTVD